MHPATPVDGDKTGLKLVMDGWMDGWKIRWAEKLKSETKGLWNLVKKRK